MANSFENHGAEDGGNGIAGWRTPTEKNSREELNEIGNRGEEGGV